MISQLHCLELFIISTASCMAVNNHWTGLVDWTTGLDYWTGQIYHKSNNLTTNEPMYSLFCMSKCSLSLSATY